jgi:hypothetical protein
VDSLAADDPPHADRPIPAEKVLKRAGMTLEQMT